MTTAFTELLGCELPLQLATLGGVGTLQLAAAVAEHGGFGMVPAGVQLPGDSSNALGTGFLMPFAPSLDSVEAAARAGRLVEFFYAAPRRELVDVVHGAGALCAWQAGSVDEAEQAEQIGCDLVIIQGVEAGGHVRGSERLRALLPRVLRAVRVPVVAAGGIATAESVAELLALGASGVRVGTRFVACSESAAHPDYVAALTAAQRSADTVLTTHFDKGWPGAPHRVLRASLRSAERSGIRSITPPTRGRTGDVSGLPMYAGEGVGEVNGLTTARAVIEELMALTG